jgi:phosphate-selective porin OprO/OprP
MPDFVNTGNRVFDAHVDQKLSDHISVRAGKFKAPVSLERLQSATDLAFIERGAPTNLAPNRDFGAMVYGNILSNVIEYQAGIFNGNQDLGNTDNDDDDKKDFIARIFSLPFSNTSYVPLQNLGLGIAGSVGDREGNPTKTILGNNVSAAQQTIFRYRSGSNANTDNAYANGTQWRLYPQGYWFYKNFGLLGEYAISNVEVTRNNISDSLQNRAYQLSAGYVLTGERLNFSNRVQPFTDFDLDKGTWGAFELVARVTGTQIDDKAFPNFANITQSVKKADTVGLGVNWYLNKATKFSVDFEDTRFKGGATFGDRPDEKVILSRVQFNF